MSALPEDVCLQCQQSRAEVKRNEAICGTLTGYEYRELDEEWPRHHWRDWSSLELARLGITLERQAVLRRASIADLRWEAIASTCDREGHVQPDPDMDAPDHCARCFADLPKAHP